MPHLLRNSIDHGIESASERGAKQITGHLGLRIFENLEKNELTIEFWDDGRGIDPKQVAKKAVELGVIQDSILRI